VAVRWRPPARDGGAPIISYKAIASPGGASCTTDRLSCTLHGLAKGRRYLVTVTDRNKVGVSRPSVSPHFTGR
jgi:hypothetical protein